MALQIGGEPFVQLTIGLSKDNGRSLLIARGQGGTLHHGEAQVVEFADLPVETEHQVS